MTRFLNFTRTKKTKNHTKGGKRNMTTNRKKELKYFCLQYGDWKSELQSINLRKGSGEWNDPTFEEVAYRDRLQRNIKLVDTCIKEVCDSTLSPYVYKCVTKDKKYEYLRTTEGCPCGRRYFYELIDRFYLILSQKERTF